MRIRTALCLFAFLLIPSVCSAQTTVRTLGGTAEAESFFWIKIEVASSAPVASMQGTFRYDPLQLELNDMQIGNALAPWGSTSVNEMTAVSPGFIKLKFTLLYGNALCCGSSFTHVFALKFAVRSNVGNPAFGFDDSLYSRQINAPGGSPLSAVWTGGTLNVVAPNSVTRVEAFQNNAAFRGHPFDLQILIRSRGTENAIGFTLLAHPWHFRFLSASAGADAGSATLQYNSTGSWRVGILLALPAGQTFAAGTRQIVTVHFMIQELSDIDYGYSQMWFSDSPVLREAVGANADPLPLVLNDPNILVTAGLEGDVSPRPGGSLTVSLADFVQVGRFAAGLDSIDGSTEFIKADCAPRSTYGDGRISLADFVQAGRYAARLDTEEFAGGPNSPTSLSPDSAIASRRAPRDNQIRTVLLTPVPSRKSDVTYAVELDGFGDENAVSFSLEYSGSMKLVSAEPDDPGAAFHVNQSVPGKLGIILAAQPGLGLGRRLMTLKFEGKGDVKFAEGPVAGELVTVDAEAVGVVFGSRAINLPGARSLIR